MYLLKKLPWQGLIVNENEIRFKKVREHKKKISVKELTEGLPGTK